MRAPLAPANSNKFLAKLLHLCLKEAYVRSKGKISDKEKTSTGYTRYYLSLLTMFTYWYEENQATKRFRVQA